jgi:hypothetical protein
MGGLTSLGPWHGAMVLGRDYRPKTNVLFLHAMDQKCSRVYEGVNTSTEMLFTNGQNRFLGQLKKLPLCH